LRERTFIINWDNMTYVIARIWIVSRQWSASEVDSRLWADQIEKSGKILIIG
jgi:hypothetical protein